MTEADDETILASAPTLGELQVAYRMAPSETGGDLVLVFAVLSIQKCFRGRLGRIRKARKEKEFWAAVRVQSRIRVIRARREVERKKEAAVA